MSDEIQVLEQSPVGKAITVLSNELNSLLSTEMAKLQGYTNKISEIATVSKPTAPLYIRDFILAYDHASQILAILTKVDLKAKATVDHAEAIAFLERSTEYLKKINQKDTVEARKQYVSLDQDVIEARDLKARAEAVLTLVKNKVSQFRMAHDDVKKIVYGDNFQTGNEGF